VIFVTVGTNETPFDRLITALERLPAGEELVIQNGASKVRIPGAAHFDFLPYDAVVEHVRAARVVVTHGGVGSVIVALAQRRRPVVVPRLRRFGEAVDDHQLTFGQHFARAGLITLVQDPQRLAEQVVADSDRSLAWSRGDPKLALELRGYLQERVADPPRAALETR
jgi:beta-1,4-N-acetylglucosaminyltransferase